jgi:hypothetical protein
MNDPRLPALEETILDIIRSGKGTRAIKEQLGTLFPQDLIDKAISNVRKLQDKVYDLEDPNVIIEESRREIGFRWYAGPNTNSNRWNFAKEMLQLEGRSSDEVQEIESSAAKILGLLNSPGKEAISRGLVLGYVQSGKTSNFISTIAQAADAGFRLIIVLSGVTNNLRKQTQERLEQSLTGHNPNNWNWLTTADEDFSEVKNANDLLSSPDKRIIAVVKKNNGRLKKLKKWLESAPQITRQGLPVLVIDDEADQATVNSSKALNRQTAINRTLTEILDKTFLPINAYLGYTATPFANILSDAIDQSQLFPRDFIFPMSKPESYFGAEELFGRQPLTEDEQEVSFGRDIVIPVGRTDVNSLGAIVNLRRNSDEPVLPQSLIDAVLWFILATTARRVRIKTKKFSTMLVHTSGRITAHQDMKKLIVKLLAEWARLPSQEKLEMFRELWEKEKFRGVREGDLPLPMWDEISEGVEQVLNDTKVIVDNSASNDRLHYDFENEHSSVPVIVVGGNTLARGLTLEGLTCSYFLRTSSNYDSLLQMGRWFGYRKYYEDLQRIWMQSELIPMFQDLALIEEEIRLQISELAAEGLTPIQIPIKIREHPIMNITSVNKMNYAQRIQVGYSEQRIETISFSTDTNWLTKNLNVTQTFVNTLVDKGYLMNELNPRGYRMAKQVPWELIKNYLSEYMFSETARRANGKLISEYVNLHQSHQYLTHWNIFFYQNQNSKSDLVNLGANIEISPINRSAKFIDPETGIVNIHHLVSSIDGSADVPIPRSDLRSAVGIEINDSKMRMLREKSNLSNTGLLGIYLVDGKSKSKSKDRSDLNLEQHIVGLGFFFPKSQIPDASVDYMGPILPNFVELEDENYLDTADSMDQGEL